MFLVFRRAIFLVLSVLLFVVPVRAGDTAKVLFIQTAENMVFDGKRLTLIDVSPRVIWFTDRPEQKTGYMTTEKFLSVWAKGANSFAADPPNVVLVIKDTKTDPAVIEISAPQFSDNNISYIIEIIEGKLPPSGNATTLIIDGKIIGIDL